MQIKKLFPPLTEQWKKIYEKERPNLTPNAITGEELAAFVQTYYEATLHTNEALKDAVCKEVQNNAFLRNKLNGKEPDTKEFLLADGSFVGIDLVSGWFIAENDTVRDELVFRKGLDEADLDNVVRTVDWLRCKNIAEEKRSAEKQGCMKFVKKTDANTAYHAFYTASHVPNAYAAYIRGDRCTTRSEFFREFSAALQFPDYFGENWDAVDECLCDMEWLSFRSLTIVIDGYEKLFGKRKSAVKNKEILCRTLESAGAFWAKLGIPFCVIAVYNED